MDIFDKIFSWLNGFFKLSTGGVSNNRKLALIFVLVALIYSVQVIGSRFTVQISQPLARCSQKSIDNGDCSDDGGGGGGTTATPTPNGTDEASPTPGHTHTPPIATDRNVEEFQSCFSYDTFDSGLKPGEKGKNGDFTFGAGSDNTVNSRKFPKLAYGGNVTNNCQETVHFLFAGLASDKAGSDPKQMGDGDLPDNAFKRLGDGGYSLDFPGKIARQSDAPLQGKWRIEFDTKSRNCGRVGAFSAWRRYNLDPKTGDVTHDKYDHPTNGVKQDFPFFNAVFDYGVDCRPGQNTSGVPPNPALLKVTCSGTRAFLTWNIPTGANSNSILKSINGATQTFLSGIKDNQTAFTDTIDPAKFYQWTHKSAPNVKSNTVSCGTPNGGAVSKLTAVCQGLNQPVVTLKWTIADGATQNIIDKREPPANFGTLPSVLTQTIKPFQTTVPDSGVSLGRTYEYAYRSAPGAITSKVTVPVALNTCNGTTFPIPGCDLPSPDHPLYFGYYYTDTDRYGDFRSEVKDYTNLYLAGRINYSIDEGPSVWEPRLQQDLSEAAADNRKTYLFMDIEGSAYKNTPEDVDRVLNAAKPHWDKVVLIDLGDEPNLNKSQAESQIQTLKNKISALGLEQRPIGVTLDRAAVMDSDIISANGLDFVAAEANVDPPGSSNSQTNIDQMNQSYEQMRSKIPSGKKIVIIMQAYARNGGWTNIATLKDLQTATYLLAHNDPRVIGITMFSYGRSSGTREHPELKAEHRKIAQAMGFISNACTQ